MRIVDTHGEKAKKKKKKKKKVKLAVCCRVPQHRDEEKEIENQLLSEIHV
jgi:hypothetical protein